MSGIKTNTRRGFTIVELLIVIVVIAILAAISIVAYNGIQNRTADTVVQSDIRNFANKVAEYNATEGFYPKTTTSTSSPTGIGKFAVTRGSYATDSHNFVYCEGTNAGVDKFIIVGKSRSGKRFAYSSDKGLHEYPYAWGGVISVCTNENFAPYGVSYGYRNDGGGTGVWWPWTE